MKSKLEKDELTGIQKEKASDGVVVVWLHETHTQALEINNGDKVRIKTKGDSPYVGMSSSNLTIVTNFKLFIIMSVVIF